MSVGAIVLAGGVGSRMRPLTDTCPKPLLPLGSEPLIGYQLRRLAAVGVRQVVLSTGYLAEQFDEQLGDGNRFGVRLLHSVEDVPLGTGGAMRSAVRLLPEVDRVVVLNGDLLSSHRLDRQLGASGSGQVCLHVRAVPDVSSYGLVQCDGDGRVTGFAEKAGSGPGLVNAGTYVVPAGLLRSLPPGHASWERELLPSLIAAGADVRGWQGDGYFRDVGSPASYRLASVDAVTGVLPGAQPAQSYVATGACVAADASLTGGTSVQAGVVVESGAVVDASVVLTGARIGRDSRVVRCVVAEGAVVSADANRENRIVTG